MAKKSFWEEEGFDEGAYEDGLSKAIEIGVVQDAVEEAGGIIFKGACQQALDEIDELDAVDEAYDRAKEICQQRGWELT